jgi:hypothetical protein
VRRTGPGKGGAGRGGTGAPGARGSCTLCVRVYLYSCHGSVCAISGLIAQSQTHTHAHARGADMSRLLCELLVVVAAAAAAVQRLSSGEPPSPERRQDLKRSTDTSCCHCRGPTILVSSIICLTRAGLLASNRVYFIVDVHSVTLVRPTSTALYLWVRLAMRVIARPAPCAVYSSC